MTLFFAKTKQLSSQDEYQNGKTYSSKAYPTKAIDSFPSMYFSGVSQIKKVDKILSECNFQIPYMTRRNA